MSAEFPKGPDREASRGERDGSSRRLRRWALALVAVSAAVTAAIPASPVSAHASLEVSVPAPSSILESAPSAILLDFDEAIEPGLSSIQLFDSTQRLVDIGEPESLEGDSSIVRAALGELDDGVYAVVWRVASADGHVVDGAFGFTIGTASSDVDSLVEEVSSGASVDPAVRRAADVARFVLYLGLVLLIGVGAWSLLLPDDTLGPWRRRLPLIGWVMTFGASAAGFGLYGATAVAGRISDAFSPEVWGRIDGTQSGRMTLIRLALLAVLGGLVWKRSASPTMWWRQVAVAAAMGVLITLPASGHPSAASPKALYVLLDAVHLVSIVAWMGGLTLFASGRRAWLESEPVSKAVRTFSRSATVLVPVIVVTGVAQAYELAGGFDTLTETSWGRTLLVKLSIVSVVVAIGAVSRWLLQNVGSGSLRRTVMAEAALGAVVLAFTASLVTLPPQAVPNATVFNAALTQSGLIADVTITPGRVGSNELHLILTPPGGSIQPVTSVQARISLDERDVPATPIELTADGPDHFTGPITLAFSGDWSLDLIIEVTPGNTLLITTTVPIP
jgi:copper transport protein